MAVVVTEPYSELYRKHLSDLVNATGQEIIDRAEELVGNGDMISDFCIWARFPQDSLPTIEVQREHIVKNAYPVLTDTNK